MSNKEFRAELVKFMPGYNWTVHKTKSTSRLEATGIQTSGFNRLSTLSVIKSERDGETSYEAKSSGFGLRAKWLHCCKDRTLARALRGLQSHYEATANTYQSHADSLKAGREQKVGAA